MQYGVRFTVCLIGVELLHGIFAGNQSSRGRRFGAGVLPDGPRHGQGISRFIQGRSLGLANLVLGFENSGGVPWESLRLDKDSWNLH